MCFSQFHFNFIGPSETFAYTRFRTPDRRVGIFRAADRHRYDEYVSNPYIKEDTK